MASRAALRQLRPNPGDPHSRECRLRPASHDPAIAHVASPSLLAGAPPPPTKKGLRKTGADRAADAAARSPSVLLQGGGPDSAAFEPAFEAKLLEKLRHVFGQLSSVCGDPESPRNGSLVREMLGRFGPGPARVRGTRAAPSQPCPQPASLASSTQSVAAAASMAAVDGGGGEGAWEAEGGFEEGGAEAFEQPAEEAPPREAPARPAGPIDPNALYG